MDNAQWPRFGVLLALSWPMVILICHFIAFGATFISVDHFFLVVPSSISLRMKCSRIKRPQNPNPILLRPRKHRLDSCHEDWQLTENPRQFHVLLHPLSCRSCCRVDKCCQHNSRRMLCVKSNNSSSESKAHIAKVPETGQNTFYSLPCTS